MLHISGFSIFLSWYNYLPVRRSYFISVLVTNKNLFFSLYFWYLLNKFKFFPKFIFLFCKLYVQCTLYNVVWPLALLIYFLFIFYLSRFTLLDFSPMFSQTSLPFYPVIRQQQQHTTKWQSLSRQNKDVQFGKVCFKCDKHT